MSSGMVNGLHLSSTTHRALKALYRWMPQTSTHSHTNSRGCYLRCQPAHQERLGVQCLAQGIELATFRLLNDSSTSWTTITPNSMAPFFCLDHDHEMKGHCLHSYWAEAAFGSTWLSIPTRGLVDQPHRGRPGRGETWGVWQLSCLSHRPQETTWRWEAPGRGVLCLWPSMLHTQWTHRCTVIVRRLKPTRAAPAHLSEPSFALRGTYKMLNCPDTNQKWVEVSHVRVFKDL